MRSLVHWCQQHDVTWDATGSGCCRTTSRRRRKSLRRIHQCPRSRRSHSPTVSRSGQGGSPCQSGQVAGCPYHFGRGRRDAPHNSGSSEASRIESPGTPEVVRRKETEGNEPKRQWHKPGRHLLLRSLFKNNRKFFSQMGNGGWQNFKKRKKPLLRLKVVPPHAVPEVNT